MVVTRPSKLALLSIYAIVATIALSRHFVRDISLQLQQNQNYHEVLNNDENVFYQKHFLPDTSPPGLGAAVPASHDAIGSAVSSSSSQVAATATATSAKDDSSTTNNNNNNNTRRTTEPKFPILTHIVTQGKPRTATTLLFNMVAASYFLYLTSNDDLATKIPSIELLYWQRERGYKVLQRDNRNIFIAKSHLPLENFLSNNTVIFTAASTKQEAYSMRRQLKKDGHVIAFVQDMETLKEGGVLRLVEEYVAGYGLSMEDELNLKDYFGYWEVLRQCCGQQMSMRWRNDMMPQKFKISKFAPHPTCKTYDIDAIEQSFMSTTLYALIEKHPTMRPLNKPSMNDGILNGTYCSSYNHLVRTQGLSIWGQPGGRPVRSKLDGAIKEQINLGTEGLKPEGLALFNITGVKNERIRKMFRLSEEEKKVWLKAVLAARVGKGGKTYEDYGIEPTTINSGDDVGDGSAGNTDGVRDAVPAGNDDDDDARDGESDANNVEKKGSKTQQEGKRSRRKRMRMKKERRRVGSSSIIRKEEEQVSHQDNNNGSTKIEKQNDNAESDDEKDRSVAVSLASGDNDASQPSSFDNTRAIFLISFGKEASESTLVERCILSLRRRGNYTGHIIVLTDAPPNRYQNEWSKNDKQVIVMHPLDKHLNDENGKPLFKYTRDNTSLKSKRFKTFIVDYVGLDARLDSVELIYYLDIDIMAGNDLNILFEKVERKYEVVREDRSSIISSKGLNSKSKYEVVGKDRKSSKGLYNSRLYFFTPISKEWPLQGGTFIVERRNSLHCLELWRNEIDTMTISGRGRDQDALRTIYNRIEKGTEKECELVRMENENHITFPTPRTFDKLVKQDLSVSPTLIHISNSVFAKWIDTEAQNEYISKVLRLSEEERGSGKYDQVTVKAEQSDM